MLSRLKTSDAQPQRCRTQRRGLSLLELLAVVALMGVFTAAVASRFGRDILGDVGVRGEARKLSLGMLEAKRSAVRTGDQHGIQLYGSTGDVSSWAVIRVNDDGSRSVVDGPFAVEKDFVVKADRSEFLFDFEGHATSAFNAKLVGPHRQWAIQIFPLTGMIDCQEVTP
ncbi:MAG: hypothetical protein Aurels2KO_37620 [Aureliella sp.]